VGGFLVAVFLYTTAKVPAETQLIVPVFKNVVLDIARGSSCLPTS